MRNKDICIFASEDDCPKNAIRLTCEECEKHMRYKIIEKAVEDFTSLGESFTNMFVFWNKLCSERETKVLGVDAPIDSIIKINKVMSCLLTTREAFTEEETVYRRLIFYFFNIIIDEFNESEYTDGYLN